MGQNDKSEFKNVDIVIVGAGLAGLTAANELRKKNRSFLVLEARNRVGGRTWTKIDPDPDPKYWIDMGAQWIGPTHKNILALADEMKVKTISGYPKEGDVAVLYEGKVYTFNINHDNHKDTGFLSLLIGFYRDNFKDVYDEYQEAWHWLDKEANTLPKGEPWLAKNARELDSKTVQSWMDEHLKTEGAKFIIETMFLLGFASIPADVSLLHLLYYIRCAGFSEGLNTGLYYRFEGGSQAVANATEKVLNEKVKKGCRVSQIRTEKDGRVTVSWTGENQDRHQCQAKQVIVALPPALIPKINFVQAPIMSGMQTLSALPASRRQFNQRMPMGTSIKCHLVYEEQFWMKKEWMLTDQKLAGIVFVQNRDIGFIANSSEPGENKPGIIGCFIETRKIREKYIDFDENKIVELVTKAVEEVFEKIRYSLISEHLGSDPKIRFPPTPKPKKVYVANWSKEEWSEGCYAGVMAPGVWTGFRNTLREPVGPIHWAGTETANEWFAYMDGAVQSGKLAAAAVDKELGGQKS
ncbi:MAG: FAD-dependent oxidoreductase [Alcanivoracaceae bacterium]|nr:FAD-dependent oxidoreductase [Alcanivoracaceae bacterium]